MNATRTEGSGVAWAAAAIIATTAMAMAPGGSDAATIPVPARPGAAAAALQAASRGDEIVLARGTHTGPLRVDREVVLRGEPGAVVDGQGRGSVIEITAARVRLEDLEVRGSGNRVITADAAVRVTNASNVVIRRVVSRDVLYGVYAERSESLSVVESGLRGRVRPLDEAGSGNGIHLWYSHDALLRGNTVERFADGVYLSFANRTRVEENRLQDQGRYGLHTMYCQDNRLERNRFTRNVAGCAIMFSNALHVTGNDFVHNRGSRTYGLLLRDCSAGTFTGNTFADNTIAIFMDNSNRNRIRENLFQDNGWGLLIFSSCAGNEAARNVFLNNDYPVALDMRRSDNRFDDGAVGNFWSENGPYDLDADGVSDIPYSPVSAFAFLSKQYPDLSVLAKSPAVAAITVAERVFPALRPSEIVDNRPLVSPGSAWDRRAAERDGRTGVRDRSPKTSIDWGAAAWFGGLLAAGVSGLFLGRVRS